MVAISSLERILGECSIIHSPPALFFFFLGGGRRRGRVWGGGGGQRGGVEIKMFHDKLRVSSFPDKFPHFS